MEDVEDVDVFNAVRLGWLDRLVTLVDSLGPSLLTKVSPHGDGGTVVHWAAMHGQPDVLEYLLGKGCDPNVATATPSAIQPIHYAAVRGHLRCIQVLLSHGVDINSPDSAQHAPLHKSCISGQVAATAYLIGKGAKVDARDKDGGTALHWAAIRGHAEIVLLCLGCGIDPSAQDFHFQTALHLATVQGFLNIVKILVDQGANLSLTNTKGQTALDLAKDEGATHQDIATFLMFRQKRVWWHALFHNARGVSRKSFALFVAVHAALLFIYLHRLYPGAGGEAVRFHHVYLLAEAALIALIVSFMRREPGFHRGSADEYQHEIRRFSETADLDGDAGAPSSRLNRLCHACRHVRPQRAAHCSVSNRCVNLLDHYNHVFMTCVGYKNRARFFLAMLVLLATKTVLAYWAWQAGVSDHRVLAVFVLALGLAGYAAWAVQQQAACALSGQTLYEYEHRDRLFPKGQQNPYNYGMRRNCLVYFRGVSAAPSRTHFTV